MMIGRAVEPQVEWQMNGRGIAFVQMRSGALKMYRKSGLAPAFEGRALDPKRRRSGEEEGEEERERERDKI